MTAFMARLTGWRTTTIGITGTAVAVWLWNSFGCQAPASWGDWFLLAVPALVGILTRDKR